MTQWSPAIFDRHPCAGSWECGFSVYYSDMAGQRKWLAYTPDGYFPFHTCREAHVWVTNKMMKSAILGRI